MKPVTRNEVTLDSGGLGEDAEGGVAIDARFKLLCDEHAQPFLDKHHNEHATCFMLMHALTEHLFAKREPQSAEEIAAAFKAVTESGKAVCCVLGDEVLAKVLAKTPTATGDSTLDEEIALTLEPTAGRLHKYPKLHQSVQVREGAEMYFLTLGRIDDTKDMPGCVERYRARAGTDGELLAMITSGHPEVGDGHTHVLDLKRVPSERAARCWFEEALKAKAWLQKQ